MEQNTLKVNAEKRYIFKKTQDLERDLVLEKEKQRQLYRFVIVASVHLQIID